MPTHAEAEKWALRLDAFLFEHAPDYFTRIYNNQTKVFIETMGVHSAIGCFYSGIGQFHFYATVANMKHVTKLEKPLKAFCLLNSIEYIDHNKDANDENYALPS